VLAWAQRVSVGTIHRHLRDGREGRLRGRRLLMLGFMLSQLALRLLSAILGGYGIFCLIMSFAVPEVGAQAFILLATATAIVYCAVPGRPP
jgi:hypothetical protein